MQNRNRTRDEKLDLVSQPTRITPVPCREPAHRARGERRSTEPAISRWKCCRHRRRLTGRFVAIVGNRAPASRRHEHPRLPRQAHDGLVPFMGEDVSGSGAKSGRLGASVGFFSRLNMSAAQRRETGDHGHLRGLRLGAARAAESLLGTLGLSTGSITSRSASEGSNSAVHRARAMNGGQIIPPRAHGRLDSKSGVELLACWTRVRAKATLIVIRTRRRLRTRTEYRVPRRLIVSDAGPAITEKRRRRRRSEKPTASRPAGFIGRQGRGRALRANLFRPR